MPSVIVLQDSRDIVEKLKNLYFLVREEDFPVEAVQFVQNQIVEFTKDHPSCTRDDLIELVEDIVEEYAGTLIPFKLYLVHY